MATTEKTKLSAVTKDLDAAAKALSEAIVSDEQATDRAAFPDSTMRAIINFINQAKGYFAAYANILSPAERGRKIGAGIKNWGFVEACYASAKANPQFLPSYLPVADFTDAMDDFMRKRTLYMALQQFLQEVSDSMLTASDLAYRDALEYYNTLKVAAREKVPGAETEYKTLSVYFKRTKTVSAEPTEKQLERDIHALLHGSKDGKVVIENERPVVSGGKREVVDEVFSGHVAVKEDLGEVNG
ncbi:MAG: hypothetical protein LBG77_02615 [Dysgonamonadaceae bacterium]|jgi:hypothetical protein|nr:hypothetical protein [Dysgonamonadaceae bacterium]